MNEISYDVALKFCEICDWTYECWVTHKRLFHENDRIETTIAKAEFFTKRLSIITQEYALLQICKLHDPAIQGGSLNLSIDYIVRFGDWGPDAERIKEIVARLESLFKKIKIARNKALAHNDFEALMDSSPLGAFQEGEDVDYFSALQELVDEVGKKLLGHTYIFDEQPGRHVDEFLDLLERA